MRSVTSPDAVPTQAAVTPRTLAGLVRYFLKLGSSGFGGPIALVGYMQRDLVEQRGWFSESEYRQGLARTTNKADPLLWGIATGVCVATAISGAEIVWLFLIAGAFGIVYYGGGLPRWRPSSAASFSPAALVAAIKGFAWTGSGSALGS